MKKIILLCLSFFVILSSYAQKKTTYVKSYTRKDGTQVRAHTRGYGSSSSHSKSSSKSYNNSSSGYYKSSTDSKGQKDIYEHRTYDTLKTEKQKEVIKPTAIIKNGSVKSTFDTKIDGNSIIMDIQFSADKKCIQKNQKMKLFLENGESFMLTNTSSNNCDGNIVSRTDSKDIIEKLSLYKITCIQIATDKGIVELFAENAEAAKNKIVYQYQVLKNR